MTSAPAQNGLAAYVAVTAAYWAFMLTDGALRMLVLLHFHRLGFSSVQLAYLSWMVEFLAPGALGFGGLWSARRGGVDLFIFKDPRGHGSIYFVLLSILHYSTFICII